MTNNWPQEWNDPTRHRSHARLRNKARVAAYFKANRPSANMAFWLRTQGNISRQRVNQIETHIASVTQATAQQYAEMYGEDPLRIQLRTGECPPDLAYTLGWELWDKFSKFLTTNLQGETK